ncbi:hypothetical protein ACFSUD_10560 [Sulfitobacter aestuarii]|uniref:Metal-dependent hydrolase n=1 Tax=Sulfitobacter aestuarii TaxID=2161676 RepID=A0ABW5U2B5_9RHOB
MPNTLAHIGIQSLASRGLLGRADIKWVWFACVLPDLPWIGHRLAKLFAPTIPAIDLRLYAVVQSSLMFCLILAAGLALVSRRPGRVFVVLAFGSLVHLLLDASQIKWGNGIVLFAPFDWRVVNFGFYWPEHLTSYLLTAFGFGYAMLVFLRNDASAWRMSRPGTGKSSAALFCLILWGAAPLAFMSAAERANVHDTQVLRQKEARIGREIAFDRTNVLPDHGQRREILPWSGERLTISGDIPTDAGKISLRGHFVAPDVIEVAAVHVHTSGPRDWFSYLGLAMILALWGHSWYRGRRSLSCAD